MDPQDRLGGLEKLGQWECPKGLLCLPESEAGGDWASFAKEENRGVRGVALVFIH